MVIKINTYNARPYLEIKTMDSFKYGILLFNCMNTN